MLKPRLFTVLGRLIHWAASLLHSILQWRRRNLLGRVTIYKVINGEQRVYMHRLNLLRTRWFSIRVHRIHLPDQDRFPHDHPWHWASLILRGHYFEESMAPYGTDDVLGGRGCLGRFVRYRRRGVGQWTFHKATTLHRLYLSVASEDFATNRTTYKPVTTLFITGRDHREWGFEVEEWNADMGLFEVRRTWVPWHEYLATRPDMTKVIRGAGTMA